MKKLVFASVLTLACAVSMTAYADGCKCGHAHNHNVASECVKSDKATNLVYNAKRSNVIHRKAKKVRRENISLKGEKKMSDYELLKKVIHNAKVKMWMKVKKEGKDGKRVMPKHLDYDFKAHEWVIENVDGTTNKVNGIGSHIDCMCRALDKMRNKTI